MFPRVNGELHPMTSELRDYVTAGDSTRYDQLGKEMVRLNVSSNLLIQKWHDICFARCTKILEVKHRLHRHGGAIVDFMELYLRRGGDTIFLHDDNLTLEDYGVDNGMELYFKDNDPHSLAKNGGLEDVSLVQKYEISEEDYEKREKTLRNYVKKQREQDPNFRLFANRPKDLPGQEGAPERPATPENVGELYTVGARCQVGPGDRRGAVGYVGPVEGTEGTWIGVALDEPQGLNDGTKNGKHYFDCTGNKYGCFSRPENVEVGDFPERDPFACLDDEDEI